MRISLQHQFLLFLLCCFYFRQLFSLSFVQVRSQLLKRFKRDPSTRRHGNLNFDLLHDRKSFYDTFYLDYGSDDNERIPGYVENFIRAKGFQSLNETDMFSQWLFSYIETGDKFVTGRIKPFYVRRTQWPNRFANLNISELLFFILRELILGEEKI